MISVARLFVHPFKGLRPVERQSVRVLPKTGVPFDRCFAFAFEDGVSDEQRDGRWLSKSNLAVQNDWAALAEIEYEMDFETFDITFHRQGRQVASGNLSDARARKDMSAALTQYLSEKSPAPGANHPAATSLCLLGATDGTSRYPDRERFAVSLLNLNSLRALCAAANKEVDIRAFRGNVVLDGIPAWEELSWVGRTVQIGACKIQVAAPIARCNNINVHPEDGSHDPSILAALAKLQRGKFGIVAHVEVEGDIKVGDSCNLLP